MIIMRRLLDIAVLVGLSLPAFARICVLSLLEVDSKAGRKVEKAFRDQPDVDLFEEASLSQIRACFSSEAYEEILWVSHGSAKQMSFSDYSVPVSFSRDQNGDLVRTELPIFFFESLIANGLTKNLKRFRIATCGVDLRTANSEIPYSSSIGFLIQHLVQSEVMVDISPKNKLGSFLTREPSTRLTVRWLRESLKK